MRATRVCGATVAPISGLPILYGLPYCVGDAVADEEERRQPLDHRNDPKYEAERVTVVLQVRNISKAFGEAVAVKDVSLRVTPGETVGLLGVNGAGKTTIMNMILELTTPSSGTIEIFGMDLAHHRIEILKRTNFCTTYAALPSNLKVRSNLKIFARLYGVGNPGAKTDELLDLLEIPHLANRVTGHLSAGESTRVNLAKALLNDPDLLLLDEPTASLDPDIADKVRKIVRRVQADRHPAIVYTSH